MPDDLGVYDDIVEERIIAERMKQLKEKLQRIADNRIREPRWDAVAEEIDED